MKVFLGRKRHLTLGLFVLAGCLVCLNACAPTKGSNPVDPVEPVLPPLQPASSLQPVYARNFRIQSSFWNQRLKNIICHWIPFCYRKLSDTNLAEGGIENFVQAGRKLAGSSANAHVGYKFSNAYVLNTVEAMCNALLIDPQGDNEIIAAQNAMREKLNEWLPIILAAQEPDGYLQTWTTLGNQQRWNDRAAHEGYVAGYFLEAACAHYLMTDKGDPILYNAAKKLANCWVKNIGSSPKKTWWDGHQEMEQALTRFARFVNSVDGASKGDSYVRLAKFLLDSRLGGDPYDQSHTLPVNQTEAVGHAVRAVYMYSAMADVAVMTNSSNYFNACILLWDNLVNKKMYLTGGVGSGETSEGFGANYSLPNVSYCESCANCGMLFFQHKMNMAFGDGKYADLMELVLYNGILGSLDLEAGNFCYTNPLDQDSARYPWHGCPCCVGNIPRTLLSLPTWIYARDNEALYVNLFVGSTVNIGNVAGTDLQIVQKTEYPWSGNVTLTVNPSAAKSFSIKIRVPDRSVSTCYASTPEVNSITSLAINGELLTPAIDKGYAAITRTWHSGDRIDIVLPLPVQRVHAVTDVLADMERVALQVGPLVYNIETVDHQLADVSRLALKPGTALVTDWQPELLDGVLTVNGVFADGRKLFAVPNFVRNNRGGRSLVWIREKELQPPPEFMAWYKFDEGSGTSAADNTGNGYAAALHGGAFWGSGKIHGAVVVDGTSGYLSLPAGMFTGMDDFTIATWIKLDSITNWARLFDFGAGPGAYMFLAPLGSGTMRFAITVDGAGGEQQVNAPALAAGTWKHVALTLGGHLGILYVDGVEVGRNAAITLTPAALGYTPSNYLGKSQYAADPNLHATVDDFRIYGRALSAAEVAALFAAEN